MKYVIKSVLKFVFVMFATPCLSYYSQYGQDKYLHEKIFKNKKGFFVDIGAHDGITLSNTYFFEKKLGWTGICIEPHSDKFIQLQQNRVAKCYNTCISDADGIVKFLKITGYAEMLSGIIDAYDSKHLARIESEIKQHGGCYEILDIQARRLNHILLENNFPTIDLLSIDVEGAEEQIILSIDFKKNIIKYILVENNYKNTKIQQHLKANGYRLIAKIGIDDLYQLKRNLK